MKHIIFSYCFLVFSLGLNPASASPLLLKVGEPHFIPAARLTPVTVPKGGFLKVVDQGSRLKVLAKKPGAGTLRIGPKSIPLVAMHPSPFECTKVLQEYIDMLQGLRLTPAPLLPEVTGELWRLSDWKMIAELAQQHQCPFQFRAHIPIELRQPVARWLTSKMSELLASFRIHFEPHLHIEAADQLKKFQREKLELWGLQLTQGLSTDLAPLLKIDMVITDIAESKSRDLGLTWQDGQAVQLIPKAQFNGTFEQLLNFLGTGGTTQSLAEPSLAVRSGEQAEFISGGEIPIRQVTYRRQQISWKSYGLTLRVKPRLINRQQSHIKIESEISTPDFSQAIDGVPSLRRQRFTSQINAELGQWVAINSLNRLDQGHDRSGVVGGMDIPLLHPLFSRSAKNKSRHRSITFLRISRAGNASHDK